MEQWGEAWVKRAAVDKSEGPGGFVIIGDSRFHLGQDADAENLIPGWRA